MVDELIGADITIVVRHEDNRGVNHGDGHGVSHEVYLVVRVKKAVLDGCSRIGEIAYRSVLLVGWY